jgi:hypothetical protein
LTYAWDLDGDGVFEETGRTAAYAPRDDTAEPVIVRVRVTNDYSLGQAEATATVTVRNVAPSVDAGPDAYVAAGQGLSRSVRLHRSRRGHLVGRRRLGRRHGRHEPGADRHELGAGDMQKAVERLNAFINEVEVCRTPGRSTRARPEA